MGRIVDPRDYESVDAGTPDFAKWIAELDKESTQTSVPPQTPAPWWKEPKAVGLAAAGLVVAVVIATLVHPRTRPVAKKVVRWAAVVLLIGGGFIAHSFEESRSLTSGLVMMIVGTVIASWPWIKAETLRTDAASVPGAPAVGSSLPRALRLRSVLPFVATGVLAVVVCDDRGDTSKLKANLEHAQDIAAAALKKAEDADSEADELREKLDDLESEIQALDGRVDEIEP
jgi:hypothetical protein